MPRLEGDGHQLQALLVQHRREAAHKFAHVHRQPPWRRPLPRPPGAACFEN